MSVLNIHNLIEHFLVSLKELLVLFLNVIKKWVSNFTWITLMIVCLWDVLKCPLSLVSDKKSTKISFMLFQNVSQNSFLNPSLPWDFSFCMLFRESFKSFSVKSSQSYGLSSKIFEILIWLRKLLISTVVFCLRFLKRVS